MRMKKRNLKKAIASLETIAAHRGGAAELTEIGRRLGIDYDKVFDAIDRHAKEINISK